MQTPLVSICCITYNHAPYIHQCLDGFVMQKTDFPIEVLIHDDASTDGTADIIREYEQKYPETFKPIYQTENQYSKGIDPFRTYIFPRIQGKYMALCEGDDYWIDKKKLQKQVDFMEANNDFSICFHPVKVYNQNKGKFIENYTIPPNMPKITDIKTLANGNFINTPSVLYRNNQEVFNELNNFPNLVIGDYLFHMLFARHGKIVRLPQKMAVYRIHDQGIWSTKNAGYTYPIWLNLLKALLANFDNDKEVSRILKEQYLRTASDLLDFYITNNDFDSQEHLISQVENLLHENSYFLFIKLINNLKDEICSIRKTWTYRLGRILLTPLRVIRYLRRA